MLTSDIKHCSYRNEIYNSFPTVYCQTHKLERTEMEGEDKKTGAGRGSICFRKFALDSQTSLYLKNNSLFHLY